jgi:acylphosphatase
MDRAEFTIRGVVHGVGFRYFIARNAQRLGLKGFTMNERGGSVYVVIEGEAAAINDLLVLVKAGPGHAVVDEVIVRRSEFKNEFKQFEIKY